jgi:hypothetical protein
MIPIAEASLDSIPADFIKFFLGMSAFLLANYAMLRKAGAVSGKKEDPVHVQSPIETKKSPIYADKFETTAAITQLNLRLENLEQRISSNYTHILEAGQQRAEKIDHTIHEVKDAITQKIDDALQQAYSRINNQDTRLSRIEGQLSIKQPRARD